MPVRATPVSALVPVLSIARIEVLAYLGGGCGLWATELSTAGASSTPRRYHGQIYDRRLDRAAWVGQLSAACLAAGAVGCLALGGRLCLLTCWRASTAACRGCWCHFRGCRRRGGRGGCGGGGCGGGVHASIIV